MAQQKLAPYFSLSPGIAAQPFHSHFEKALAWGSINPGTLESPKFIKNIMNFSVTAGFQYQISPKWQLQSGVTYFQHTVGVYHFGRVPPFPSPRQWYRFSNLRFRTIEIPVNLAYQKSIKGGLHYMSRLGISAGYFIDASGMYQLTAYPYRISHYPYLYATGLISTGFAYHFPNASALHILFDFNTHFTRNVSYSYDRVDYDSEQFFQYTNQQNMTEGEKFRYWRTGITLAYVFNTRSNTDNMLSR
jgi:hypothetical protein